MWYSQLAKITIPPYSLLPHSLPLLLDDLTDRLMRSTLATWIDDKFSPINNSMSIILTYSMLKLKVKALIYIPNDHKQNYPVDYN